MRNIDNLRRDLAVLAALRDGTDYRLAELGSTPATPTWSVLELADAGWFPFAVSDREVTLLTQAAERLYRVAWLGRRTVFTEVRWFITEAGRLHLAEIEKRAGLAEVVAAEAEASLAELEERRALARTRDARRKAASLRLALPRNRENMLLDAALGKVVALDA